MRQIRGDINPWAVAGLELDGGRSILVDSGQSRGGRPIFYAVPNIWEDSVKPIIPPSSVNGGELPNVMPRFPNNVKPIIAPPVTSLPTMQIGTRSFDISGSLVASEPTRMPTAPPPPPPITPPPITPPPQQLPMRTVTPPPVIKPYLHAAPPVDVVTTPTPSEKPTVDNDPENLSNILGQSFDEREQMLDELPLGDDLQTVTPVRSQVPLLPPTPQGPVVGTLRDIDIKVNEHLGGQTGETISSRTARENPTGFLGQSLELIDPGHLAWSNSIPLNGNLTEYLGRACLGVYKKMRSLC